MPQVNDRVEQSFILNPEGTLLAVGALKEMPDERQFEAALL